MNKTKHAIISANIFIYMELHLNFAVKLATYTTNATYTFLKNIGKKMWKTILFQYNA